MFQIRGRISGNSLNVPCASVHPEGQLKQKGAVTLGNRCQLLEQGRQRTANWCKAGSIWWVMEGCFQDGWVYSVSEAMFSLSGLFPLLSKVSISAALLMFCHPKKEALQYSLISNSWCEMHCQISGSGCWICSTFHCTVRCCHIPPVSWGRAGPCGKTGDPSAHSHPAPSSPPSLSPYCHVWGNDDFPLDLGEG